MMFMQFFFFLIFIIKAHDVGTNLNCIDIKYSGGNLKTTELLDCVLIGVSGVIRSNTDIYFGVGTDLSSNFNV